MGKVNGQVAVGFHADLRFVTIDVIDGFQPFFGGEHILLALVHADTDDNVVEQG